MIYRAGRGLPLMVKLPYSTDNRAWLRGDHRRQPAWNRKFRCWETPASWLDDLVSQLLYRFGRLYLIQPFRVQEKCAPACWRAQGFECECSCMGANHGSESSAGKWWVVSDTFALQWQGRELACRLIRKPD